MIKRARLSNVITLFLIAIVTVCIVAGGIIFLIKTERPTHKFLMPTGFTGWVEVTYEQSGFPALKKEGRSFIYEVPPAGKIMTSSKDVSGPRF